MQRLAYWLIYPLLLGLSKLPFWLFYRVSDMCFVLVYYIIGYRKKVVASNLRKAFPKKSDKELKIIRKAFYRHMCDMFLEMIKTLSISKEELKKRFLITNPEELTRLESLDKSIVVMCAHYASYEWLVALRFYGMTYKSYGIYKKIKNPYFDSLVKRIRSRYNTTMITTKETPREMTKNKFNKVLAQYGMIADQAPKGGKSNYWMPFMGIETPVFTGTEALARRLDLTVTFLNIEKVKRGYYEATFKTITTDAPQTPVNEITTTYFNFLEAQIRRKPEFYLWTHKRWKHTKS